MIQEEVADSAHHQLLRELYKIAIEEYRFNVNQNADRQKFFVGLNVAVSSIVPTLFATSGESSSILPSAVLILAAFTALLGVAVIERSHQHYRNARRHFQEIEQRLGLDTVGLGLTTTSGMRTEEESAKGFWPKSWFRVYRAVQGLLVLLLAFDLVAAVMFWP